MAEALYGPRGYYTSERRILGPRGDFTTTPKLSQLLAREIAQWILAAWKYHGKDHGKHLPVIELGPGDGTLAHHIRRHLPFLKRRSLDYHFVEISPSLARRQKAKNLNKGEWHLTLKEALIKTNGSALIISNEFFDAFPVRIFNDRLEELFLDAQLTEVWQAAEELPASTLFKNPPARFEVAESIQRWCQSDLSELRKGDVLSIDYGGNAQEVYHRRPLGSLRGYAHHMRLLPPEAYQNPGKQDLTFDVSFPDLIEWGQALGLKCLSLSSQAEFLKTNDHEGAGGAFKVLHQRKS